MSFEVHSAHELPMHALRASEDLPAGPYGVREISTLCDAFVLDTAAAHRGGMSPEVKTRINASRRIAAAILAQEGLTPDTAITGREKAALKQASKVADTLRSFGIDVSNISIDEAFIIKELAEAVESLNQMIESADPLQTSSEEHVLNTANSLANWMDMFIKLHQRFDLDDDQVYDLFRHLFQEGRIHRLMAGNRLEKVFTAGLYGELSAYLHLYSEKQGSGTFTVPSKMYGGGTAVDLIWEDEGGPDEGIEYYEIKSDPHVDQPTMIDVSNDDEYLSYIGEIRALYGNNENEVRRRLRSVNRIRSLCNEVRSRNPSAKFYSVRVPSLARKDTI